MSFGYSVGDFILLVQLAHRTFRNCQKAGEEYNEIACEVHNLHSVLRTLRSEAQRPDSKVFKQDASSMKQLIATAEGCKNVLTTLDIILAKYEGLKVEGEAGARKKLWQKLRFGSKTEELGVIRGKLIAYTSTISVLLDIVQIKAADRVESKIDKGFMEIVGRFEKMRKEIYNMASQARAVARNGSTLSLLSLSTYKGDDKEVWQDFRRELINKGFSSQNLDKYKAVLQAYMLKLDQSGILDKENLLRAN
jgi:predicted small secreted protein